MSLCQRWFLPSVQRESGCRPGRPHSLGDAVNKSQLIDELAERFDGNRKVATHALDSVVDVITRSVSTGERVVITGFGVFERSVRKAGTARNPRTGETVKTRDKFVAKFRPGSELKDVVSGARIARRRVADSLSVVPATAATAAESATRAAATGLRAAADVARGVSGTTPVAAARKSTAANATATARPASAKKTSAKKTTAKKTSARRRRRPRRPALRRRPRRRGRPALPRRRRRRSPRPRSPLPRRPRQGRRRRRSPRPRSPPPRRPRQGRRRRRSPRPRSPLPRRPRQGRRRRRSPRPRSPPPRRPRRGRHRPRRPARRRRLLRGRPPAESSLISRAA